MQHRPAPPGETLKQEQMAQAQESNVKRKGQDQTEMQWAAQVVHFIFVEKKQTNKDTQFCHWWQGWWERRIFLHKVLSNQEKETLASARHRIWQLWEVRSVREQTQRRSLLHLVACEQVGTSLQRALSSSNLMARAGGSAVPVSFYPKSQYPPQPTG